MIIAPGADCFIIPFENTKYAHKIPSPGPGFVSKRKKIDWPNSAASSIPNGPSTP